MERRNFLKSVTVASLTGVALTSCANTENSSQETSEAMSLQSGIIFHAVYFWLKEGLSEEEEKDFLNFFEELRKVPGVLSLQFGKPAPTTPRPVVDNSFQYHLLATFRTMEDINIYETHAIHTDAVERYNKYWTKVEVKDTVISG